MKILIINESIVDFDVTELAETIASPRAIYPKGAISGWAIIDATIPADFALGRYNYISGQFVAQENAIELQAKKDRLILKIDTDVDLIISAVVGKREIEYLKAEEHALAYIAANYTGTVPAFVQDWADAKNETATWAADNIAATAAAWRAAQASLRSNRLAKKEAARTAADIAALATVETAWNTFITAIKQQLGIS
jgi:hypothetical protein